MTTQTETNVKYDRVAEIFTPEKYAEAMGVVEVQKTKRGAQIHQGILEFLAGYQRFTYQTLDGTATIRVNREKRTIELSTLVDESFANELKKVLEIN